MSVQTALDFIQFITSNEPFRQQIEALDEWTFNRLRQIAGTHGFDFSRAEYVQAFTLNWSMRAHNYGSRSIKRL